MRVRDVVASAAIIMCSFYGMTFSQDCVQIDGLSSASQKFSVTSAEACEDYATIGYNFRYRNGALFIEWGTSESYGNQKDLRSSNPVKIDNLEPNTTYHVHIWGEWARSGTPRTYEYVKGTFTTTGAPANEPPEITSANTVSCSTETSVTYTITADDPDGDDITFSAENLPAWISLDGETLTFAPTLESSDTVLKIIASDGKEGFDTLDLAITVVHVTGVAMRQNVAGPVTLLFGKTRLNIPAAFGNDLEVTLYSMNGSRIMRKSLKVTEGMNGNGLLPKGIVPGIYLVQVNGIAGAGTYAIGIRD